MSARGDVDNSDVDNSDGSDWEGSNGSDGSDGSDVSMKDAKGVEVESDVQHIYYSDSEDSEDSKQTIGTNMGQHDQFYAEVYNISRSKQLLLKLLNIMENLEEEEEFAETKCFEEVRDKLACQSTPPARAAAQAHQILRPWLQKNKHLLKRMDGDQKKMGQYILDAVMLLCRAECLDATDRTEFLQVAAAAYGGDLLPNERKDFRAHLLLSYHRDSENKELLRGFTSSNRNTRRRRSRRRTKKNFWTGSSVKKCQVRVECEEAEENAAEGKHSGVGGHKAMQQHAEGGHFSQEAGSGSSFVDRDVDYAAAVALVEGQDGAGNNLVNADGSLNTERVDPFGGERVDPFGDKKEEEKEEKKSCKRRKRRGS